MQGLFYQRENRKTRRFAAGAALVLLAGCFSAVISGAEDALPGLSAEQHQVLKAGECVQLPRRPDEAPGGSIDEKFTTFVIFLPGVSAKEAWDVVNDKEGAVKFWGGILKSKVIEKGTDWMRVEQETAVGGPKKSYHYVVRHRLFPFSKTLFTFEKGDMNDLQGGWWFIEDKEKSGLYLVYSLYIDPGRFAPQFIVRSGMRKSLPETLGYIKAEIFRRKKQE